MSDRFSRSVDEGRNSEGIPGPESRIQSHQTAVLYEHIQDEGTHMEPAEQVPEEEAEEECNTAAERHRNPGASEAWEQHEVQAVVRSGRPGDTVAEDIPARVEALGSSRMGCPWKRC